MKTFLFYSVIIMVLLNYSCANDEMYEPPEFGIMSDIEGNTYKTVKIGTQIWMSENLAYLPIVCPLTNIYSPSPRYYVYGYSGTSVEAAKTFVNYTTYGVLYNWAASLTSCPKGWHLPSNTEWMDLSIYLGGESAAEGKMKETGTTHWLYPNTDATNESGFSGLPGGNLNMYEILRCVCIIVHC
jgi:uncharacterized protein (TIGR02145 family)